MSCSQIQSRVSMDQPLIIPGELGEDLMILQHAPSDLQLFQQLGPNDVLAHFCASCIVASLPTGGVLATSTPVAS
jgi:hypothetical protein